jgi:hypothetical protein
MLVHAEAEVLLTPTSGSPDRLPTQNRDVPHRSRHSPPQPLLVQLRHFGFTCSVSNELSDETTIMQIS